MALDGVVASKTS